MTNEDYSESEISELYEMALNQLSSREEIWYAVQTEERNRGPTSSNRLFSERPDLTKMTCPDFVSGKPVEKKHADIFRNREILIGFSRRNTPWETNTLLEKLGEIGSLEKVERYNWREPTEGHYGTLYKISRKSEE